MHSKPKQILKNSTELARQKQMLLLLKQYGKVVKEPNTWILPYVYVVYFKENGKDLQREEFICHTSNILFAGIIFEAQKLPAKITIVDITISGYEKEFSQLIESTYGHVHQNI